MKYTIFYDSHCPICVREMKLMHERCPNGHLQAAAIDAHLPQLAALSICGVVLILSNNRHTLNHIKNK